MRKNNLAAFREASKQARARLSKNLGMQGVLNAPRLASAEPSLSVSVFFHRSLLSLLKAKNIMSDSKEPTVVKEEEDLTEMDNVDTDDLLEEAEATLKSLKPTRKTRRTRMKKTKSTEDMDIDPVGDNSGSDAPKTTRSRRKTNSSTAAASSSSKRTRANGKSATQSDKGKKVNSLESRKRDTSTLIIYTHCYANSLQNLYMILWK